MKVLKFDIGGQNAFFKNPELNIALEVTYEHIPKTIILGILGAIIGLKGRMQERELGYIEWWEELKDVKVAIVPFQPKFRKFIDKSTNATGFANKDGMNQIITRQYLENPKWTIFIQSQNIKKELWNKLVSNIKNYTSEYPIYLGQTSHRAIIENVELIDIDIIDSYEEIEHCESILKYSDIYEVENEKYDEAKDRIFKRIDYMPIALNELSMYKIEKFVLTNCYISVNNGIFYRYKDSIISFI